MRARSPDTTPSITHGLDGAAALSGSATSTANASGPARIDFEVEDVTVSGAVELFVKRTGQAVQIGPLDLPYAMCKKVRLRARGATASEILDAFDAALAGELKRRGAKFILCILGEGEERKFLETLIQEQGLGQEVQLLGFVSDGSHYLRALDIFALPPHTDALAYALI